MPRPEPKPGEVWISRDRRDNGLRVEVYGVSERYVYIIRLRKSRVRRDRWHREYRAEGWD